MPGQDEAVAAFFGADFDVIQGAGQSSMIDEDFLNLAPVECSNG